MKATIIKTGILATLQDAGRIKGVEIGLTPSGVMDTYAYDISNALVGNAYSAPVIEVTAGGFSMRFNSPCLIAITGAKTQIKLDGVNIKLWESYLVPKDALLELESVDFGFRNYIAIGGQWLNTQTFLGSSATDMKTRIGGLCGDKLKPSDQIEILVSSPFVKRRWTQFDARYHHQLKENHKIIRIIKGPQWDAFDDEQIKKFLTCSYEVHVSSDRMGIRLEGDVICHKEKADIITDIVVMGAIQVPGNGKPIIMMADRQVSGGYTKIATVIQADLPILAQTKGGDTLNFEWVELEKLKTLNDLEMPKRSSISEESRSILCSSKYKISLSQGQVYDVLVERLDD